MTQQEFVKKMDKPGVYIGAYADGLTKGLEIAKELLDFAVNKYFSVERLDGNTYWAKSGETGGIQYLTSDELLTIFLTEKYGKQSLTEYEKL